MCDSSAFRQRVEKHTCEQKHDAPRGWVAARASLLTLYSPAPPRPADCASKQTAWTAGTRPPTGSAAPPAPASWCARPGGAPQHPSSSGPSVVRAALREFSQLAQRQERGDCWETARVSTFIFFMRFIACGWGNGWARTRATVRERQEWNRDRTGSGLVHQCAMLVHKKPPTWLQSQSCFHQVQGVGGRTHAAASWF